MKTEKQTVAISIQKYLNVTATFIYRQLQGVSNRFRPIVFASGVSHLDSFPLDSIYARVKWQGLMDRVYRKLVRTLFDRFVLSPSQVRYWKEVLKREDVRLIHAHFGPSGLQMLPLAKALGIPLLVTFHGFDASSLLRSKRYAMDLSELFKYAHLVTVSKLIADRLIKIGADPSKIEVHYIGIPVEDFQYVKRIPIREKIARGDTLQFLQVSSMREKKGHKYTLAAFRDFLSYYPDSRLTLAGDGPLRNGIEKLCAELGIRDKVSFTGKVTQTEVISLMSNSDVFLHHSVTGGDGNQEGIPTVLMEAMATGLPVVSTYHSGIPELVRNGIDGYLVEERDIKGYVNKLKELVESNTRYGENAAERVRLHFNISKQNKRLADIYKKTINDRRLS
jgi:glycosyltransferase involved in cell wall biosynthesis